MFYLKNKVIVIVSPQKWGKMHISKHHYAIELAKRKNIVYFLNPPMRKIIPIIKISKPEGFKSLFIVNYSFFFPYNLRFHFRTLFDKLQRINVKFILKKIKTKIDIVWCFDTNLFSNLSIFNCDMTIYHPVDNITGGNQKQLLKTSDFVFSVSNVIIDDLKKKYDKKEAVFINHGLSEYFINITNKQQVSVKKKSISAYFVGNVLLSSLDRNITKKIIEENENINFIFIGSYLYSQSNIVGTKEKGIESFISFLKKHNNVFLKGAMHPEVVAKEIQKADVFLILIDPQKDINKGSNSHKILEYFSTGKAIVANHISTYADKRDLFEMVDEMHNDYLPILFKKVINNLDYYNSPELQKKRIEFALDNTYEKQIERIEKIIDNNGLKKNHKNYWL